VTTRGPDPFDAPEDYLSRWLRAPPQGGRYYLHQMVDEAGDYLHRRNTLEPLVVAHLALRASLSKQARRPPARRGRPTGEVGVEAAFARAMVRWAERVLPEPLLPGEVLALAVIAGIQKAPPRLQRGARATNRRDQRELIKARWRAAFRVAKERVAEERRSAEPT
jgi:hypothetical protein